MPGFADSFWSSDYAAGLGVLFGKLQQGVIENRQVLTIARMRAEAEDVYGQRLGEITPTADKVTGGFTRDDGATVRKVRQLVHCACSSCYIIATLCAPSLSCADVDPNLGLRRHAQRDAGCLPQPSTYRSEHP